MYLFDFVAFSVHGHNGVSRLDFSMLIALCKHYIPNFLVSLYYLHTRTELLQLLWDWVCAYLLHYNYSTKPLCSQQNELALEEAPKDIPVQRTHVLVRSMLPEVWHDMNKTVLLTWLSAGPWEVGTAACGKLSADQWRTTCTVHLVIILGRLWGTKTHNDCFYQMYSNFMDLVSPVKLATYRSMTSSRSAQYKE